jgi:hypothetical protein
MTSDIPWVIINYLFSNILDNVFFISWREVDTFSAFALLIFSKRWSTAPTEYLITKEKILNARKYVKTNCTIRYSDEYAKK